MKRLNQVIRKSAFKVLSLIASLPIILTSCQDEDFGYDVADVRQSVYARNFEEQFGAIDPNHNWSMAQSVKVNLLVPNAAGYRLRILTEAPTNRESIVLYQGQMQDDDLSVNVDVVRGTRNLYVEVKSELGTYLVDGYYNINKEGIVAVNKMTGTRADAVAPSCNIYQTTLTRWRREWFDEKMTGDYRWDKGFVSYEDHLTSSTVSGWDLDGNNTKSIDLTSSHASIYGVQKELKKCILFKNNNSSKTVTYNGGIKFLVSNASIHVPLAVYSGNPDAKFTIVLVDEQGAEIASKKDISVANQYTTGNSISFLDVTLNAYNLNADKTYKLKVTLNGNNQHMAVCGGFYVETGWSYYTYQEEVTNGQIRYTDVRGGGVNISQSQTYNGNTTYRNNYSNTHYNYRTYDVTKMTGRGEGLGFIGTFYIIGDGSGTSVLAGTEKIKYRDQFPLYGLYKSTVNGAWKGSPFREGDNHIDPFFSDGSHTATDFEMQKDAQLTTLGAIHSADVNYDGSVSIKLVGIGTGMHNDVGYFYYPKSEESSLMRTMPNGETALDFNKIPKVIIRKEMQSAISTADQPQRFVEGDATMANYGLNAIQFSRYVDGCTALSMTSSEFEELKNSGEFKRYTSNEYGVKTFIDYFNQSGKESQKALAKDASFEAPIYKLPYYGWKTTDGKYLPTGSATYEWPKDMVIGFFGIRTSNETAAELARIYTSSASVERNYFNDMPRGSAFSYKGKNYIGLEDEWDYDNNDFLFEVIGVQSVDPDITPEDDIVDTKTTQDWLIACEDLGGVWDYDFNDLIWAVTKEVNTTTTTKYDGTTTEVGTTDIYFTPLAAGGTLDARVEYNTSIALGPNQPGWDESAWISLGEIHQMVTRDTEAPTDIQVNVDPKDTWNITKDRIGLRIKLGSTIPTNDQAITIESILSHFRVRVKHNDGEYVVANVHESRPRGEDHNHEHGGSLNYGNDKSHAPQFILLPKGWAWPAEGVCITEVYGLNEWFKDQNETGWLDTWRDTNSGKTGAYIVSPI